MSLNRIPDRARITDIFIHRPVLAVVIPFAILLLGVRAAIDIPVLQFPSFDSASLIITTPYVGASAEVVQGFITDPIERVAVTIPGVDYVDSTTTAGLSTVTVWLELNEDSTDALAELSSRLEQIKFELPAGAEDPSVEVQRADRPFAVFYIDVQYSGGVSRAEASDYIVRRINPVLSSIPAIQTLDLIGGRLPAMRIWIDPARMASFNVSPRDLRDALLRNNIIATIGRSENEDQRINLLVNTSLKSVEDFERMVIREDGTTLVRVRDVARVELGEEEGTIISRIDNEEGIYIGVYTEPGANELAVGDRVYEALEEIERTLPEGMSIRMGNDVTRYMRKALVEIFITLAETVLLVGLVVVAFMGSIRTAFVPLVTIPISLLGSVAVISAMGFTLNLLTVLAIVLSVGLVVDDAIVVVENVARYMRQGMGRLEAALASSRQLFAPIIGMTLTLAAVYAPIGFLSGLTGVLFKEFALTLATAVLISGVVALTLSPIMSAHVCPEGGKEGRMTLWVNEKFSRLERFYGRLLDKSLELRPQVLTLAIFLAFLIAPMFLFSKQELAPLEDQESINVIINSPPDATVDYTVRYMDDTVKGMGSLPGADNDRMWQVLYPEGGFSGQGFGAYNERPLSVHELLPQAYGVTSAVAGLQLIPVLSEPLPTAGRFGVELVVVSSDPAENMLPYAEQLKAAAQASGIFLMADKDLQIDLQQGHFQLNRERVGDLGMDLADVSAQVGLLLSGNYVNRFELNGKAYKVIPMLEKSGRADPDALMDLEIRTPAGDLVPLGSLVHLEKQVAPRYLRKFEQKNAFRIFGVLIPGVTSEQGLSLLEDKAAEILPDDYSLDYAGNSRQLRTEGNTLIGVLGIALAFVFFVLVILFNSIRDPLVVLLGSVPLALSGATFITFMDWTTVNIFSQVGFITLVGLISKNAILIVEFANQLQFSGHKKLRAIREAATIRLRPVLMTTGATVVGHLPLVFVSGAGAAARNSIGIILVAGMLIGTLFTLFILPSIYMLIAQDHNREEAQAAHLGPVEWDMT